MYNVQCTMYASSQYVDLLFPQDPHSPIEFIRTFHEPKNHVELLSFALCADCLFLWHN